MSAIAFADLGFNDPSGTNGITEAQVTADGTGHGFDVAAKVNGRAVMVNFGGEFPVPSFMADTLAERLVDAFNDQRPPGAQP